MQIRKLSFKIIHSSTILLPAWVAMLKDLDMPIKMIPHDVSTHWNSTFDVADFVCKYHVAIEAITDKQKLGLTDLALDEHEWGLLKELRGVLKVCRSTSHCVTSV